MSFQIHSTLNKSGIADQFHLYCNDICMFQQRVMSTLGGINPNKFTRSQQILITLLLTKVITESEVTVSAFVTLCRRKRYNSIPGAVVLALPWATEQIVIYTLPGLASYEMHQHVPAKAELLNPSLNWRSKHCSVRAKPLAAASPSSGSQDTQQQGSSATDEDSRGDSWHAFPGATGPGTGTRLRSDMLCIHWWLMWVKCEDWAWPERCQTASKTDRREITMQAQDIFLRIKLSGTAF